MAYQSLYRRYRPQTFAEIRGQPHLVAALQNAVVRKEVGHAYLLHGPRGTGKTSSARVLAKALNCEDLSTEGEPCGACESCVAIEQGRSFDLHELDAAGNNRVEDMRALLSKVNLGTPGRVKVYVLDEVHMLTSAAENALLKTLEEPPDHVVWVLATTEPHKVVDTIRSRCQEFELSLLGAEEMAEHVRRIADDAELGVGPDVVDHVVAAGGGSVRDTLSALDRVVAAGGMADLDTSTDVLLEAIAAHDVAAALKAIGDATGRGRDPRTIGESVLAGLRDGFLVAMDAPPPRITQPAAERAARIAEAMPPARMTRALEMLGRSLVEMRQAPDPLVDLEVTLVRLCRSEPEQSAEDLADEIKRLARRLDRLEDGADGRAPRPAAHRGASAHRGADSPPSPPPVPAPPDADAGVAPDAGTEPAAGAAQPEPGPAGGGEKLSGPAAARRVLAEKVSESAVAPAPKRPPAPRAGSRAPAPLPDQPKSPTEVVRMAERRFGLSKQEVVSRAEKMFGPAKAKRTEAELARLWQSIVDEQTGRHTGSGDSAPPDPVAQPDPAATTPTEAGPEAARKRAQPEAEPTTPPQADAEAEPRPTKSQPEPAAARDAPTAPGSAAAPEPSHGAAPEPEPMTAQSADFAGTADDEADHDADHDEFDIDPHSLVDAPAHQDVLISTIQEIFPGATHHPAEEPQQR